VRLDLETDDDGIRRTCDRLVPVCQAHDAAFLLAGRTHLVAETGADGVHIDGAIDGVRAALPENAILGAGCGLSRHDALVAGENEADYVSFGPMGSEALEIVAWWNGVVVLPCVVEGIADTQAAARAVEAGADFLALDAAVWNDARGPAKAVAEVDAVFAKDRGR
jgi:thiamine-phosphate pyrophosphorylase